MSDSRSNRPTVRYLILMPWGRVGSNLLVNLIQQQSPGKFSNERLNSLSDEVHQREWYSQFFEVGTLSGSKPMIGAKENILKFKNLDWLSGFMSSNEVRLIRMRRDNLVKAAISQIRAEAYAKHTAEVSGTAMWAVKAGEQPLGAIRIEPSILMQRIGMMKAANTALTSFQSGICLDIEYQMLNQSIDRVVDEVCRFLSIGPKRPYRIPYEKATPESLEDAVENFTEIATFLKDTEYFRMLF